MASYVHVPLSLVRVCVLLMTKISVGIVREFIFVVGSTLLHHLLVFTSSF